MSWDNIPRTHSFSLGDFHDFDRCIFRFFVNHHLEKKYELAEGSPAQAIGSLLDLAIKKLHTAKAYNQPVEYLQNLIKAAELEMKDDVAKRGLRSFYGSQVQFLTPEVISKAKLIFKDYLQNLKGEVKKMVPTAILLKSKPFWKRIIKGNTQLQIWGGPDSIEMGEDGMPEVVDYKYLDKGDESTDYLDMDLMPKLYILLCAEDLLNSGYKKARFVVRLWHDPKNESFYEEFDLETALYLENFFKDKIERILRTDELYYCKKDYCKPCRAVQKEQWVKELQEREWIKTVKEAGN
ncbi:MAG: PD-(D/E)XK nuclease family protein [Candidatus Daviesbacteria bacterium]|nr:PD-(D/E)XK nuclease family protein [Candidatus Daviesbacteria bacterium]